MPAAQWPEHVTGKAVLGIFAQALPAPTLQGAKNKALTLRRLYMDKQLAPPPDLAAIVDTMLRETERLRRRS
jgi:hypothetical protein